MQMKMVKMALFPVMAILLAACGMFGAGSNGQPTTTTDSLSATQTAQGLASPSAPTAPPATASGCPVPTVETMLLKVDDDGYCLLYPQGHGVVQPFAGEACLLPGGPPYTACNGASLIINVDKAKGRSLEQVADAAKVAMACGQDRYDLTVAHEKAVAFAKCYGQDTTRRVFIVHNDRLYTLTFIDLSERIYLQAITSFTFLP